jgi:solute:Na+ symporter, SSS family
MINGPDLIAFELYGDQIVNADDACPYFEKQVLPVGFVGVIFAALFGAVMSTQNSLLNSAATIFTIDVYNKIGRQLAR